MVVEYNKELNQELLDRQAVANELARQLAYHRKIIDDKEKLREVCKDRQEFFFSLISVASRVFVTLTIFESYNVFCCGKEATLTRHFTACK